MENSSAEGVVVDNKVEPHGNLLTNKSNSTLGCIRRNAASSLKEVIFSLHYALGWLCLEYCVQFCISYPRETWIYWGKSTNTPQR